jgi:hypothetical protein
MINPEDAPSVVDVLNEFAEGLDVPAEAFIVRVRPVTAKVSGPSTFRESLDLPDVTGVEGREREILLQRSEASERSKVDGTGADTRVMPRSRHGSFPPIACVFSASTGRASWYDERATRHELIEPIADWPTGVAEALNRFADGVENAPRAPIEGAAIRPSIEPIDPVSHDRVDLALELNQISDGCSRPPLTTSRQEPSEPMSGSNRTPAVTASRTGASSSSSSSSSELAEAMRLTRDAAYAWVRFMTSPAVVQVSSRRVFRPRAIQLCSTEARITDGSNSRLPSSGASNSKTARR